MSARKHILELAKKKGMRIATLSKATGYDYPQSFYRGLANPDKMSYKKIKNLALHLNIGVCDLIKILK